MNIEEKLYMIGIDHTHAQVDVRERFAMTGSQISMLLQELKKETFFSGAVVLSTCNRLELYVSTRRPMEESLLSVYGRLSEKEISGYENCFLQTQGQAVIHHLFWLAAGLESKILGEDQILTQIGDALVRSRNEFATDRTLEVLFREAVTYAKQVKTQVHLDKNNRSSATAALEKLRVLGCSFAGRRVLVIGNGMMGRLTAQALLDAGADVTVTVRTYRSGIVDIPRQAHKINYQDRYPFIENCDYIFSATASPNLTIKKGDLESHFRPGQIFVDLAVPRDIEPAIRQLGDIRLFDIDDFGIEQISEETAQNIKKAEAILNQGIEKYIAAYENQSLIPVVKEIAKNAAWDVWGRTNYRIGMNEKLEEHTQEIIRQAVEESSQKVVMHLLFTLRDELDPDTFRQLLEILDRR